MSYDNLFKLLATSVNMLNKAHDRDDAKTRDFIKSSTFIDTARQYAEAMNIDTAADEFTTFINDAINKFNINMDEGESLVNLEDYEHDLDWAKKREISQYYSDFYENLLSEEYGYSHKVIRTLMQNSLNILTCLGDPLSESNWDRRGLLFGHVQSGKTANFIGLISKAADAGYKMIIVFSTNDEKLRQQTQRRVDEGFIGYDTASDQNKKIGVGVNKDYKQPINLTTAKWAGDGLISSLIDTNMKASLIDRPWVVVMKKSIPRLKKLYKWLQDDMDQIKTKPLLLIDDEADYASPNTKKDEENPTKTNEWIRKILKLYDKSSYVGVTATPFANIFINHQSYTEMLDDDLFPRDMIYNLQAPDNYFGARKVFQELETSNKIIEHINDAEEFFPTKQNMIPVPGIPSSLKNALHEFIIAKCIRILRGDDKKHCTMMVNAHTRKEMTQSIYEEMSEYFEVVKGAIIHNYKMNDEYAMKNPIMTQLKLAYENAYSKEVKEKWVEVMPELEKAVAQMKLYAEYSGSSFGGVDYESYEESGLTAIVIGGFKLSRGLTLEGLTVSYLYRNTNFGDTLLQLGRFFGYRTNYDDIVRVHLRESARKNFVDMSDAIENLRMQITEMIYKRESPKDFGLYMFNNFSDLFKISSPSKTRSGIDKEIRIGYSGKTIASAHISCDTKTLEHNEETICKLINNYVSKDGLVEQKGGGRKLLPNKNTQTILDFLNDYKFTDSENFKFYNLCEYIDQHMSLHPKCDVMFDCDENNLEKITGFPFDFGFRSRASWIYDENEISWRTPNGKISGGSDLRHLINNEQKDILKDKHNNRSDLANIHYQSVIEKPVLWIMPFYCTDKGSTKKDKLYGIEFFYPTALGRDEKIKVKINTVAEAQQLDLFIYDGLNGLQDE